jgi:hypothetical protein
MKLLLGTRTDGDPRAPTAFIKLEMVFVCAGHCDK